MWPALRGSYPRTCDESSRAKGCRAGAGSRSVGHFDLGQETFPFDFTELTRVSGVEKPDETF